MRPTYLTAFLLVAVVVLAQDVKRPILSSHDAVDGPFAGQRTVSDLQVFGDGKVVYVEENTKTMGGKPEHSSYETTLGSEEMRRLKEILESREVRSLPKKVPSKTRPIDFFWQKSIVINRPDKTQNIQIENFYPFLNLNGRVYPTALIELECRLQDIETATAKRPHPKDEDDWCKGLLNKGKQ
jgi:hypothetical protein